MMGRRLLAFREFLSSRICSHKTQEVIECFEYENYQMDHTTAITLLNMIVSLWSLNAPDLNPIIPVTGWRPFRVAPFHLPYDS